MIITWDYDPLFAAVFDSNQSLRGYYLHTAHLACAVPPKNIYYFAYLKASQRAHKSFMQPTFGG